jgi:hypothetical protein
MSNAAAYEASMRASGCLAPRARRGLRQLSGTVLVFACLAPLGAAHSQAINTKGWYDNPGGQLGALAPENLDKERPAPPFSLTGTWMIDGEWRFVPLPKFKPKAAALMEQAAKAAAEGKSFNDVTGQCWPPGLPIVMTRVWPIHMIQLPTAIAMIFNFENQIRWIFLDGRDYTDPDIYVPTYNGESLGRWEGDTLVVETKGFETYKHFIDRSVPVSEQFHVTERIRMLDDGEALEIEYTMTDPVNWEGEWKSVKRYRREHKVDFLEVHCLPNLNEGIPATREEYRVDVDPEG